MPPAAQYLVKYNTYTLPGYAQEESFDSPMKIASHDGAYVDGSPSEQTGLANKQLNLRMRIWDCDYLTAKNQVELASTMLRTKRDAFAALYIQYSNRHYDALVKTIELQKSVPSSVRIADYDVSFECRPWLIDDATQTLTGTGVIDTDQVTRTINDGGWTPTILTIAGGTNVTVSGYTDTGMFTGFISVDGAIPGPGLVIDTEAFTATVDNANANSMMLNKDYRLYVGPGKTFFDIQGASGATITYNNRWYI